MNLKIQLTYFIGKDSCKGDSGGPLAYRKVEKDPWYQIGLVSFGTAECGKGLAGAYTRVDAYMDWIASHMQA